MKVYVEKINERNVLTFMRCPLLAREEVDNLLVLLTFALPISRSVSMEVFRLRQQFKHAYLNKQDYYYYFGETDGIHSNNRDETASETTPKSNTERNDVHAEKDVGSGEPVKGTDESGIEKHTELSDNRPSFKNKNVLSHEKGKIVKTNSTRR